MSEQMPHEGQRPGAHSGRDDRDGRDGGEFEVLGLPERGPVFEGVDAAAATTDATKGLLGRVVPLRPCRLRQRPRP